MIVFDSSIWVAYFNKNDSQHDAALSVVEKNSDPVGVFECVVIEVCNVLHMKAGKEIACQFLEVILDNDDISVLFGDEIILRTAAELFSGQKGDLSLVDCILAQFSRNHTVVTFDGKLEKHIKRSSSVGTRRIV